MRSNPPPDQWIACGACGGQGWVRLDDGRLVGATMDDVAAGVDIYTFHDPGGSNECGRCGGKRL